MVTQTYNLNMIPNGQIINVHVSQYDIGRVIVFNLYNGSAKFTPASGTTATIDGTKPDNKGFSLTATISGSTASFTTTKNMCAVAGDTICEFRLIKNGQNVGTANFILKVERAGLADDVDTSETELPAYEEAAQQAAQNAANSATQAAGSATTAGNQATAAADSASSANIYALKSEGYAVGKQNGSDVGSTSPYFQNNAAYFAQKAAASVAEGTQVNFYISNGHLYVQQTIQGVQQPAQDLGAVGGSSETTETYTNIKTAVTPFSNMPLETYSAFLHRRGTQTVLEVTLKTTDSFDLTKGASQGVFQIADATNGKLTPFWLTSTSNQSFAFVGVGAAEYRNSGTFVEARMFRAGTNLATVVFYETETITLPANYYIYVTLSFTNNYTE